MCEREREVGEKDSLSVTLNLELRSCDISSIHTGMATGVTVKISWLQLPCHIQKTYTEIIDHGPLTLTVLPHPLCNVSPSLRWKGYVVDTLIGVGNPTTVSCILISCSFS